jgi:hypothetical protein
LLKVSPPEVAPPSFLSWWWPLLVYQGLWWSMCSLAVSQIRTVNPHLLIVIPTGTRVENFLLVQVWFSPRNQSKFYLVSQWCCWLSWYEVLLLYSNYLFLDLLCHELLLFWDLSANVCCCWLCSILILLMFIPWMIGTNSCTRHYVLITH